MKTLIALAVSLFLLSIPSVSVAQRRDRPARSVAPLVSGAAAIVAGGVFFGMGYERGQAYGQLWDTYTACNGLGGRSNCDLYSSSLASMRSQQIAYNWLGLGGVLVGTAVVVLSLRSYVVVPTMARDQVGVTFVARF